MAHFAELDKDNKVLRVIVIDNDVTHDADGVEKEELGIAYCKELFGANTNWIQTSFNGNMHNKFAGMGDIYDAKTKTFIPLQTHPSWVWNQEKLEWEPPVVIPTPSEGMANYWNEKEQKFEERPTGWMLNTETIEGGN